MPRINFTFTHILGSGVITIIKVETKRIGEVIIGINYNIFVLPINSFIMFNKPYFLILLLFLYFCIINKKKDRRKFSKNALLFLLFLLRDAVILLREFNKQVAL